MAHLPKIKARLRSFRDDERATSTIEFVILAPFIMMIVFSILESGWLMTQKTMLDRGLNMSIRDLRVGLVANPTHDTIVTSVCNYAGILRDCEAALHLEMVGLANPISSGNATCVDRVTNVEPVINWVQGSRQVPEIMVLRACFVVDPLIPGSAIGALLPKDPSGAYNMVTYAAFANEPN